MLHTTCSLAECDCYFAGVCCGMLYTSAALVVMTVLVSCVRRYTASLIPVYRDPMNPRYGSEFYS